MKEIRKTIDKYLAKEGIKMHKLLSAGSYGLFHNQDPVYDKRTAHSYKEGCKLSSEGYEVVDFNAVHLLNALMDDSHE